MTKEKQMRELYELFLKSGQSRSIFCELHKIHFNTFKYWQRKFEPKVSAQSFVRISRSPHKISDSMSCDFILEYPNGVKLKTTAGMEVIAQLIGLV